MENKISITETEMDIYVWGNTWQYGNSPQEVIEKYKLGELEIQNLKMLPMESNVQSGSDIFRIDKAVYMATYKIGTINIVDRKVGNINDLLDIADYLSVKIFDVSKLEKVYVDIEEVKGVTNLKSQYNIGEFANILGVTQQTLRNWDKQGTLTPAFVSEGNHRLYSHRQLLKFKDKLKDKTNKVIVYYTDELGEDAVREVQRQRDIAVKEGLEVRVINDKHPETKGITDIVREATTGLLDKLIIHRRDNSMLMNNLVFLQIVLDECGTKLEIV